MHQYASYHTSVSLQLNFFFRFLNTSLFLTAELLHVSPVNNLPKMKKMVPSAVIPITQCKPLLKGGPL